jgi:hypothetical protein
MVNTGVRLASRPKPDAALDGPSVCVLKGAATAAALLAIMLLPRALGWMKARQEPTLEERLMPMLVVGLFMGLVLAFIAYHTTDPTPKRSPPTEPDGSVGSQISQSPLPPA